MSAAEEELERRRIQGRDRMRRFRENHPDAKRRAVARMKVLTDAHRDEYVASYKAHQEAGAPRNLSYDRAKAALRATYPDEWIATEDPA